MFCPNCGQKNAETQKFCRACGMNFEQTAIALAEQFPGKAGSEIERKEQRLERFGKVVFGGFGIVIGVGIIGLLYAIVKNSILAGNQPLVGVILALFVVFAALALTWVVMNEDLKEKRKKRYGGVETADQLAAKPVTNKLLNEAEAMAVNSVIEDTTDLLPVENRTRKL
jgi:hypothetical protein